ncbi:terminase gpA endonuclease subunit [Escherichia coli]
MGSGCVMVKPSMRMASFPVIPDAHVFVSFWMEGPAAAYTRPLATRLQTAYCRTGDDATGSEETLKTVINTDWGLPYLPRASMEQRKSELLEQRAEPVPSPVCRMALISLWRQWMCRRDVIAVLWFR